MDPSFDPRQLPPPTAPRRPVLQPRPDLITGSQPERPTLAPVEPVTAITEDWQTPPVASGPSVFAHSFGPMAGQAPTVVQQPPGQPVPGPVMSGQPSFEQHAPHQHRPTLAQTSIGQPFAGQLAVPTDFGTDLLASDPPPSRSRQIIATAAIVGFALIALSGILLLFGIHINQSERRVIDSGYIVGVEAFFIVYLACLRSRINQQLALFCGIGTGAAIISGIAGVYGVWGGQLSTGLSRGVAVIGLIAVASGISAILLDHQQPGDSGSVLIIMSATIVAVWISSSIAIAMILLHSRSGIDTSDFTTLKDSVRLLASGLILSALGIISLPMARRMQRGS
jgi:hypothetical protein